MLVTIHDENNHIDDVDEGDHMLPNVDDLLHPLKHRVDDDEGASATNSSAEEEKRLEESSLS